MIGREDSIKSEEKICQLEIKSSEEWMNISADVFCKEQTGILIFTFYGNGTLEFQEFSFE